MDWKIVFHKSQPRPDAYEIVDYIFQVSRDSESQTAVFVGITAQERDWPTEKKLSQDDLIKAAHDWLRSRLEQRKCDPFNRAETDKVLLMPPGTLEHWQTDPSFQCLP